MTVFVAGGSGTIGLPLVRALVAAGHEVTALTRSPGKRDRLLAAGASVAVADALRRDALMAVVEAARPTHVIHQLTALPKDGPRRAGDLDATNRLRIEGTRNLLDAAIHAGAERFVAGSFGMLAAASASDIESDAAAAAIRSMETQVLDATTRGAIEGVILRYGIFYGGQAPSTIAMIDMVQRRRLPIVRGDAGRLSLIQMDDAVRATIQALDAGRPGSTYDIVDDEPVSLADMVETIAHWTGSAAPLRVPAWLPRLVAPYLTRMTSRSVSLSNARAKAELGWQPKYPTMRDGLAHLLRGVA
jgi:nucleoside-diphosphate-sugar epimerase